jgi:hypothetical protein
MAGQYRTSQDLVTEVLANLGVLSPGQNVEPEDFNYVSELLDPIVRKLAALEIVYIPDVDNIPGAFFKDLADIVAGECANKFGATPDDAVKLVAAGLGKPVGSGTAAMSLKQMQRGRPTGEVQPSEYF